MGLHGDGLLLEGAGLTDKACIGPSPQAPASPIWGNCLRIEPVGPGQHLGHRRPQLLRHLVAERQRGQRRRPAPGPGGRARPPRVRARGSFPPRARGPRRPPRARPCPCSAGPRVTLAAAASGIDVQRLAAGSDAHGAGAARWRRQGGAQALGAAFGGSNARPAAPRRRPARRPSRGRSAGRAGRAPRDWKASATVAPSSPSRRACGAAAPRTATRGRRAARRSGPAASGAAAWARAAATTRSGVTSSTVQLQRRAGLDAVGQLRGERHAREHEHAVPARPREATRAITDAPARSVRSGSCAAAAAS